MALDFERSSSQWLDMGLSLPGWNNRPGATLMAWINVESFGNRNNIIAIAIGPPPGTSALTRVGLGLAVGQFVQVLGRAGDTDGLLELFSTDTVPFSIWTHVVGCIDLENDKFLIYINGVEVETSTPGFSGTRFSDTNSKNGAIGAQDDGSGPDFFDGIMEDVRIYARVLTPEEIQTIFVARGVDGIVDELVHRFILNEGSPGSLATAVGQIKDSGFEQRNIDPNVTPTYASGVLRFRRKLVI